MEKKITTFSIALGGILAALSVALMFLTALFPIAEFVFPGMAGILLIAAVFEMGEKRAFLIFAAVGILSLLLPIEKSSAVYYILFLGHYPIVKSYIERIQNNVIKWAVKVVFFNICCALTLLISVFLLNFDVNALKYGLLLTIILFNVTFIIYDIAVSKIIVLYSSKIRKLIKRH
ncbi:hypothetical protein V6C21_07710 [[Clostridium] cellulosi]